LSTGEANSRLTLLSDELQKKTDESASQQDEILTLEDELRALHTINKEIFDDNVELQRTVGTMKSAQNELAAELADLRVNFFQFSK